MEALKRPEAEAEAEDRSVRAVVEQMLANIRNRGEDSVREIAEKLDNWTGDFVLTDAKKQTLIDSVPESEKADLRFAHAQVKRFAEAQRDSIREFDLGSLTSKPNPASGWARNSCPYNAPGVTCRAGAMPTRRRRS